MIWRGDDGSIILLEAYGLITLRRDPHRPGVTHLTIELHEGGEVRGAVTEWGISAAHHPPPQPIEPQPEPLPNNILPLKRDG